MRPIRFCMLTTFYPPEGFGGDAIQVQRLARALSERGHAVTVVHSPEAYRALSRRARTKHRSAEGNRDDGAGIRVVPIASGAEMLSPLATYLSGRPLLTGRKLAGVLEEGFDVLHFHNPSLLGGPSLLGMGSALKLYTAHEQWLVCPTHVLWKYKRRVCEEPQCWRCTATYGRPPQLWRSTGLLERSVAELDALIAPSRSTARLHERLSHLVRIERLGHFVPEVDGDRTPDAGDDGPGASPTGTAAPTEHPYFLFVGRLEPIKGAETMLSAFRRRAEHLVIAGTGSGEAALRRAAAGLPNVHVLGWTPQALLDAMYRDALAVIVPTLGHESFGLVPVEGFARGTPAIVRRFGALEELAEESGACITFDSEVELAGALDKIAGDAALRQRLSQRARGAYLERWTTELHLGAYFRLIAELARKRGEQELGQAAEAAASRSASARAVE
jgi:glycosyltransferase involved in cell wall biosynthesis